MISAVGCQPEFLLEDRRVGRVGRVDESRLVPKSCSGVFLDKKLYATLFPSTQLNKYLENLTKNME